MNIADDLVNAYNDGYKQGEDGGQQMNTEQAIEFFEGCKHHCGNPEFIDMAISALREKQERENPKPLTLEELKDRHGKPIYAVDGEGHACWVVVNAFDEECADNEFGAWQFFYYDMQDCTKDELHPMGWLAYDHEPKESHK